jgi:methylsterol monooxygenase
MATITATPRAAVQLESNGSAAKNGATAKAYSGSESSAVRSGDQRLTFSEEHKWARSQLPRQNRSMILGAYTPYLILLATTLAWHETATAARLYTYLNDNYTPFQISFYGSLLITTGVYWALGLTFMAFDLVEPLHNLVKMYKIQPDFRPSWDMYKEVFSLAIRNLICVNVPVAFITSLVNPFRTSVPLPRPIETLVTFFVTLAFEEVGFYCVHRTFHSKYFYASVHKRHHKFTAPVALSGTYATMTEHFFVGVKRHPRR